MSDTAPKPHLSFEQARARRLTGMSVAQIAVLEAQVIIAMDFVHNLRAVCAAAVAQKLALDPASVIAELDRMMGADAAPAEPLLTTETKP